MEYRTQWESLVIAVLLLIFAGPLIAAADNGTRGSLDTQWLQKTQSITFWSEALGEERTLLVQVPYDYESSDERYPVLFLLDAEWHFSLAAADVELLSECSYIDPHPAPRLIVIGVVNTDRNRDFTPTFSAEFRGMRFPTSGGAERFRSFLIDEVVPLIDERYRTHPYRILAGWSLGGLFTVNTALGGKTPFDAFLAISPSLWWDDGWTLKELQAHGSPVTSDGPVKLVTTLGTVEEGSSVDKSTREFLEYLDSHPLDHIEAELISIEGLGHTYSPKMAYFYGVAQIFDEWTAPPEVLEQGLAAIEAYYESLSKRVHLPVSVPEDVYGKIGWGLWEDGEKATSQTVFLAWVDRHPQSPVALASLGAFYRASGDREAATRYLQAGLEAEKRCARPRIAFIEDLRREIAELSGNE